MSEADDLLSVPPSPLVWRRWLSAELTRLRKAAGITQRAAAEALNCSVGKLSYLESGDRAVSVQELEGVLLPLYEIPASKWPLYARAAEISAREGWWDAWDNEDLPGEQRRYLGLEDGAHRLRTYQPSIIHGLCQTPDYTRAILQAYGLPGVRINRLVELREARQALLTRPDPLDVHIVLDEAAIRREVGGRDTMAKQLAHMADLAEARSNVKIQIISFKAGAHGANFGPYSILEFSWRNDLGLVYIEGFIRATYLESRADIYRHSTSFERLAGLALSPDESVEMLRSSAGTA